MFLLQTHMVMLFTSVIYGLPHIYVSFHRMSCNSPILICNSPAVYFFASCKKLQWATSVNQLKLRYLWSPRSASTSLFLLLFFCPALFSPWVPSAISSFEPEESVHVNISPPSTHAQILGQIHPNLVETSSFTNLLETV